MTNSIVSMGFGSNPIIVAKPLNCNKRSLLFSLIVAFTSLSIFKSAVEAASAASPGSGNGGSGSGNGRALCPSCGPDYRPLKCYQCDTYGSPCDPEDLKYCPGDQAYDRCMFQVVKKPNQREITKRTCALAPCYLRDPQLKQVINIKDHCDKSSGEYNCYECCTGEGCNASGATARVRGGIPPPATYSLIMSIVTLFLVGGRRF